MDTTTTSVLTPASNASAQRPTLLERVFLRIVRRLTVGSLHLHLPSGAVVQVGDPEAVPERMEIRDRAFYGRVLAGGSVGLGEAYVEGLWTTNDLSGVLKVFAANQARLGQANRGFSMLRNVMNRLYHIGRRNTLKQSRENIQEHYDLSNSFYECFLDSSMTYSSAYFGDYYETLETAQYAKIDRMLDLAGVRAGDHVLEIGSGWGALAIRPLSAARM